MHRIPFFASLLLLSACASTSRTISPDQVRLYTAPIERVIETASEALPEAGLELEGGAWANDSTYVLYGRSLNRLRLGAMQESNVQVSALQIHITARMPQLTRVWVIEDQRPMPAAASSADVDSPDIRSLLRVLDTKLPEARQADSPE